MLKEGMPGRNIILFADNPLDKVQCFRSLVDAGEKVNFLRPMKVEYLGLNSVSIPLYEAFSHTLCNMNYNLQSNILNENYQKTVGILLNFQEHLIPQDRLTPIVDYNKQEITFIKTLKADYYDQSSMNENIVISQAFDFFGFGRYPIQPRNCITFEDLKILNELFSFKNSQFPNEPISLIEALNKGCGFPYLCGFIQQFSYA